MADRPKPKGGRSDKSGKGGRPAGKPGGRPGGMSEGTPGRTGPPSHAEGRGAGLDRRGVGGGRPSHGGPRGADARPHGGRPTGPRRPGHGFGSGIPDGPDRDAGRGLSDRGAWRPPAPGAGSAGPDRGPWRPPWAGGRPPARRGATDGRGGGPAGPGSDRRAPREAGGGAPRPAPPGGRPIDRPPYRGGRPIDRPPYRGGPPIDRPPYHGGPPIDRPQYRGGPPAHRPPYRGGPAGDRPAWRPPYRPAEPPGPRPPFEAAPWPRAAAALPAPDLLGPDEELVAGRRPVEEVFAAGRAAHRLLVVPQRRMALEQLVLHATRLRIPIVEVEGGSLTALAGFDGHQGVALVVEPRRFASLDDVLARAADRGEPPFVLVLDSLEDPQNVGTLLRSAEAAGAHGIVFPTRRQAPLSPAAVKASAGAVEHLLLCPVADLPGALADLRVHGLRIAGSEADAPLTARQTDLRGPLAIVVGSEGQGLGPAVRRRCDVFMRIPMRGAIGSLNAAVAGSILLFEAVAQRDPEGRASSGGAPPASAPTSVAAKDVPVPAHPAADDPILDGPIPDADTELLPGGPPSSDPSAPKKRRAARTPRA